LKQNHTKEEVGGRKEELKMQKQIKMLFQKDNLLRGYVLFDKTRLCREVMN
jgi:hypothetical protein